ncbi:MAG: AI-2E family transporter [Bacteroidota bacterium]
MKINSRYVALVLGVLFVAGIVYYFSTIVAYVMVAWVLSMIGQPLMQFFQKRIRIGRYQAGPTLAATLTIATYFLLSAFLIWTFVPLIIEQASFLAGVDYSAINQALRDPLDQLTVGMRRIGLLAENESASDQFLAATANWVQPSTLGNFFGSLIGVAGSLLFALFSIVFIAFFFLKEQGLFDRFLMAITPSRYELEVKRGIESISRLLSRYFGGIVLQISIITLFVWVALSILGIKNALLIGFFAGLINVIPYLGPFLGALFGAFITISSNLDLDFYTQMLPLLLRVAAVFAILQMLDNLILQPYIFSNSVLAHPLEIFIVISMGAQINGTVGMVLAIPVYTVLRVIARVFLSEFKIVKKLTGRIEKV